MGKTTSSGSGDAGFTSLLTVLFIGLKLAGVISWSWWWVLSPVWITLSLVVLIIGGMALFGAFEK